MEAQKIKLFQCIRNACETIGICVSEQNRNFSINAKILFVYLSLLSLFISSMAYIVVIANSALEYSDVVIMVVTSFVSIVTFSVNIWKMQIILNVIEKLEETIRKSKLKTCMNFTILSQ